MKWKKKRGKKKRRRRRRRRKRRRIRKRMSEKSTDLLIELEISQAQSTMSGDLRAYQLVFDNRVERAGEARRGEGGGG